MAKIKITGKTETKGPSTGKFYRKNPATAGKEGKGNARSNKKQVNDKGNKGKG